MNYHLAVDIGASSGRHILGYVENGKLCLQEIYRFENNLKKQDGSLIWDIENLVKEVKNGIKKCAMINKIPQTVAIDTWGVDYCLLDKDKKEILPAFCYRDSRTAKIQSEFEKLLPQAEIYKKTGKLEKAEYFLMIPEYLSFKLTGEIKNEYTNASTTGLLNAKDKNWDFEIIEKIGLPKRIFKPLYKPCDKIDEFSAEFQKECGFNSTVVFAPSHDTAAAVAACPINENSIFISSGTWSLIGAEILEPVLSESAMAANFTNEGGIEYRFRFLKNIMGMWLLQNIRRNLDKRYTYDEMMNMAKKSNYSKTIDVNAPEFVAPDNMIEAIKNYLGEKSLPIEDILACVYNSLALSYKNAVIELEKITGKTFNDIHIVGGGSSDKYLNSLCKRYTGKNVFTGLKEATATGNIVAQLIFSKECNDLNDARKLILNSFEIMGVL